MNEQKTFDERDKNSLTTIKRWGDESSFMFAIIKVS
jgi:hypothetical protein